MTGIELALVIAAPVSAVIYALLYVDAPKSSTRTLTKTAPLLCLALVSFMSDGPMLLTCALVLGAIGDAALSRETDQMFLTGLVSFLLAHLAYITLFAPHFSLDFVFGSNFLILFAFCGLPVLGAIVVKNLWHLFGPMRVPASIYAGVTTTMAMIGVGSGGGIILASLGAILFAASDCILAMQKFGRRQWPGMSQYIWWPYFLGQSLIAMAFI